ncbi:helix-turn-helix transcriptional regulator [Spongiimicrobium sp. 3-5]|uniref:helix-turn-helix transcriptional regulator n=1 Tax=Spongiimicrobium sp. 3-5 TaxID=3332596 RepID=UPI0039816B04
MSTDTLKRFDRIIAILIQLQSKRIVRAQELADRFEVSLRTIYRDIRTLESSGVPIVSEAGIGYSIMDGYRLPPVMFTREEAGSFVAAEKLMQKFTDKALGAYYESAMYKVKSVLQGKEKDWINALESQVRINPAQDLFNESISDALEILFESIAEKTQVFLKYQSLREEDPRERIIEPVGLFHENNFWYVLGYCHIRADYRQFRTDRILKISRTGHSFLQEHPSLDELRSSCELLPKTKIRISVDQKVARYLSAGRNQYGFVSEKTVKDKIEMTFMAPHMEHGFARWYLMFSDYATILEPETLKDQIKDMLKRATAQLT